MIVSGWSEKIVRGLGNEPVLTLFSFSSCRVKVQLSCASWLYVVHAREHQFVVLFCVLCMCFCAPTTAHRRCSGCVFIWDLYTICC